MMAIADPEGVSTEDDPDLLQARMLNECAYCPRLFHLMRVAGRWADNHFTLASAKAQNQRTMLRRNGEPSDQVALLEIAAAMGAAAGAADASALLGTEGAAASACFRRFSSMLRSPVADAFSFSARNRRPPRDPVNAMLSFAYAMLAKEVTVAVLADGLDPWWGRYHRPRHGRSSLALDLMEEFRPIVADSAVIAAINNGMVASDDFLSVAGACSMKPSARKALIRALEIRLDQLLTHPVFDYRCAWRQVIQLQVRLFARWLRGDVPTYQGMVTR